MSHDDVGTPRFSDTLSAVDLQADRETGEVVGVTPAGRLFVAEERCGEVHLGLMTEAERMEHAVGVAATALRRGLRCVFADRYAVTEWKDTERYRK